jgi:hypothetical protein
MSPYGCLAYVVFSFHCCFHILVVTCWHPLDFCLHLALILLRHTSKTFIFTGCILLCVISKWQGKVSDNTTNVVIQSISTQIEFHFLTATCFCPHGIIIRKYMIERTPKYGSIFSATHPYYKIKCTLEYKKLQLLTFSILWLYKELYYNCIKDILKILTY